MADATTYDPQAEADQAQQRALERDVRAAKAERAAAVTPEQQKAADRKVLEAQTAARGHAADAGVQRRMNREQLDLGHQAAPDGPTLTPRDDLPSMGRTKVVVPQAKGFDPLAHELVTADRLAAAGHRVEFLVPSRERGMKTPDILLDGEYWEMKSPLGAGKNTISNQMHRASHQADRLVLDTARTPLDDDDIVAEVQRRLGSPKASLAAVLVIRKDQAPILVERRTSQT